MLQGLQETRHVTAQILNDVYKDNGVYLTTDGYTVEDQRKGYEDMS